MPSHETKPRDEFTLLVLRRLKLACIALTALISGIALAGWATGYLLPARIHSSYIPMAQSTALSFIVLSCSMLVQSFLSHNLTAFRIARGALVLVFIESSLILCDFIMGSSISIESYILPNPDLFKGIPIGRMSPVTAVLFILSSLSALSLLSATVGRNRARLFASYTGMAVASAGVVINMGYIYGAPLLYGGRIIPVAMTTAITFVFVGASIILDAGLEYWPLNSFLGSSVKARLTRVLVPVMVAIILIDAWLNILFSFVTGNYVISVSLSVLMSILILVMIVSEIAKTVGGDIDRTYEELFNKERELKESETRLKEAQRLAHIGNWKLDLETNNLWWSEELYNIFGVSHEDGPLTLNLFLARVHRDDRMNLESQIRSGHPFRTDYRIILPDGTLKFIHEELNIVYEDGGHPLEFCGIAQDITERKLAEAEIVSLNSGLERKISERTLELEESRRRLQDEQTALLSIVDDLKKTTSRLEEANREMESFSYSVSHDLRAPLRGIDGLSYMLLEDYGDVIDEKGREYIERVRKAIQKMAMLSLSRLTRENLKLEVVDMSILAESILSDIAAGTPERRVEVVVKKGVSAVGDSRLLRIVLDNLLSNAWKYTSKSTAAQIEFGNLVMEGKNVYFVKDNGAGFDNTYSSRLFNAFQRLHSEEEFPGIGIGLATVRRIIHRHGGSVWAEGEEGHGASFYFTV